MVKQGGDQNLYCFPEGSCSMPSKPRFELYTDGAGEWRWRLVATNEEIIATSGEGYVSKQGAERGIESVKRAVPKAKIRAES